MLNNKFSRVFFSYQKNNIVVFDNSYSICFDINDQNNINQKTDINFICKS